MKIAVAGTGYVGLSVVQDNEVKSKQTPPAALTHGGGEKQSSIKRSASQLESVVQ